MIMPVNMVVNYLTKVARDQHHTVRPATDTRYRPLLDLKPSDPSTVKTAMVEAQLLSSNCGQQFVVITADQRYTRSFLITYGLLQMCSATCTHDWEDYTQS